MSIAKSIKYGPVNCCIYCGETEGTLTNEHCMPKGWGGDVVLVGASCVPCQRKINDEFENEALRLLKAYRYREGLSGKSKNIINNEGFTLWKKIGGWKNVEVKGKPDYSDGTWEKIPVSLADYPAPMYLPLLVSPPGILLGMTEDESLKLFETAYMWHCNFMQQEDIPQGEAYSWQVTMDETVFIREFAKIAHGVTVKEFGLDFTPLLTEVILNGNVSRASYAMGYLPIKMPETKGENWQIMSGFVKIDGFGDCPIVVFRPFSKIQNSPLYYMVVGTNMKKKTPLPQITLQ